MSTQEPEPDYARCSLEELYDVRRWIDPGQFPARAARLEAEIASREAIGKAGRRREEAGRRPFFSLFRDPRTLGLYMLVAGSWSLAWGLDAVSRQTVGPRVVPYGIAFAAYAPLALSGALVAFRRAGWRQAALFAWVIQLPSIQVGRLVYTVFALPAVEWKIWPEVGFSASTSPALSVLVFPEPRDLYLGVNAIALSAVVFLATRLSRRAEARERRLRSEVHSGGAG